MLESANQTWERKQKLLDQESRELSADYKESVLKDRLNALSAGQRAIHDSFRHHSDRCRCFEIEGV